MFIFINKGLEKKMLIFLGLLVGLMIVASLYVMSLRVVVPTNEVHIVQKGRKTISYGQDTKDNAGNVYYAFPEWLPIIGVTVTTLPLAVFSVKIDSYEAYDVDRLPFLVDIMAYFRVNDSNKAASRIQSIVELKEQILNIVRGAVRSIMANAKLEEILSKRATYGQQFTDAVKSQLEEWGVCAVKNIELMDVRDNRDSRVIANIMAKKSSEIEMQSRTEVAINKQKAREAEIIAQQEVSLKEEDAKREVGKRQADVAREVGLANEKAQQDIKEQAKVTKEKEMEIVKVAQIKQAEIDRDSFIINEEREKSITIIRSEAAAKEAELRAEGNKKAIELKAEADLAVELKKAQGVEANGKAEAEAKKLMELAPVNAQIELAKEIGNNAGYQNYLVQLEQIKALCEVGIEQAKNLGKADIKINAMSNDVPSGVQKVTDIFSPNGGLNIAGALETFASSPIGKAIVDKYVPTKSKSKASDAKTDKKEVLMEALKNFNKPSDY